MATTTIKQETFTPSVGTVLITNSSTNPASTYGGSWTLIDKRFKPQVLTTSSAITRNTSAVSAVENFFVALDNCKATIRLKLTLAAAITTSTLNLCTFDLTKLGWNSQNAYETWFLAWSDGGNGFAMMDFVTDGTNATLKAYKSVCKARSTSTGIASGSVLFMTFEVPFTTGQMGNSFCDRFYWKRTA